MKYQHRYHAGNFADVVKHVALVALLRRLAAKDKPFFFLDTHAGRGVYLLDQAASREAAHGVLKVAGAKPRCAEIADWLDLVRRSNPDDATRGIRIYPGSPRLAQLLLRPQDRALLCEIVPREAELLASSFGPDRRVRVECADGLQAIKSALPPRERRGLVLIDPAYERQERELEEALVALVSGLGRWASGMYCLWYPIKLGRTLDRLKRACQRPGWPPTLAAELCVYRDDTRVGLNGAGLMIVNPPWRLDIEMRGWLAELHALLARDPAARWSLDWLVPEK